MTKPSPPLPLFLLHPASPCLSPLLLTAFFFPEEESRAGSDNSQALVSVEIREERRTTVTAAGFQRHKPRSTGRCVCVGWWAWVIRRGCMLYVQVCVWSLGLFGCKHIHNRSYPFELVNHCIHRSLKVYKRGSLIHSTHTQGFSHRRRHLGWKVARDVEEQVMCVCVNGRRTTRQDFTGVSLGRHIAVKVFPLHGCVCLRGSLPQPDGWSVQRKERVILRTHTVHREAVMETPWSQVSSFGVWFISPNKFVSVWIYVGGIISPF